MMDKATIQIRETLSLRNGIVSVGLVQMSCGIDPEENFENTIENVRTAAKKGAQIICLQELFRSQYFCQKEDADFFSLAEKIPGPSTQRLEKLARELKVVVVAPLFERRTSKIYYNSAVVIDASGQLCGKYRKVHIPNDPYYYEKFYFSPGDLGFQNHSTSFGEVGILICWDQWFPEAARLTALKGAVLLFCPTAIGWLDEDCPKTCQAQCSAWETVQRGHAVANGVFWAATNRVGREGKLKFWGQSFVCDPFGRMLGKASSDQEEILIVECDLSLIEKTREEWPFLQDRRIESYQDLSTRFID